jgi:uncharacterized membrane protein YbhN (UPF0104 family)
MGNTVLPARGGEILRVVLLSQRSTGRKLEILGSIVSERVLDAGVLAGLFAVLTWIGVAGAPTGQAPAIIAAAGIVAALAGAALYLRARSQGKLVGFARRVRPLVHASRPLVSPVGVVLALVTTAVWVIEGAIFALVAQALGVHISLLEGVFLDVLASFFALIPAAPGYVGTFDGAMLFGLSALHVHGGPAISFILLVRFILFGPITLIGGILMLVNYGGVAQLRRARVEEHQLIG